MKDNAVITPVLSNPGACARCGTDIEDPSGAIEVQGSRKFGRRSVPVSQLVCLPCWYNPGGPRPEPPKPPQTLPYKTLAEAIARADKVAFQLGRYPAPDIGGNADTGYAVIGDSPMVPGYKGNPWT